MEICGGQTHAILKYGLQELLTDKIRLVHGPGCPVCVTPLEQIEKALVLAALPEVLFCSFGDMLRVPGLKQDLFSVRAAGGDVRVVYSPLDAVRLAEENPTRKVVFFSVGFETTAPTTAMAAALARRKRLSNFFLLVSHVLVPPAMHALLSAPDNQIEGFLAAGHVCTVMGTHAYHAISQQYGVPIIVTGFEPVDVLQGVLQCVEQLEDGESSVVNAYSRAVRPEGNLVAQAQVDEVFEVCARPWRGVGMIPESGLRLTPEYAEFDAERHFALESLDVLEPLECRSGDVLRGVLKPPQCAAFGKRCTPEHPLGAPMVSSEGACAAYYLYQHSRVSS
jgi:hydrogenase expression/formation protein HypD